jgi:hypothetical protein
MLELRVELNAELHEATSPRERASILAQIKSLNQSIAVKRTQFDQCLHPPLPKPDLVAKTFQIKPNHTALTLEVAAVIQNNGDGPAHGPFEVTLGVTYTDRNLTVITRQLNIHVPNTVTIEGHGTQFVMDSIKNLPLLYRSDNPKFVYDFEMIVDSANQISEVTESNNHLGFRYWTVRPATAAAPA